MKDVIGPCLFVAGVTWLAIRYLPAAFGTLGRAMARPARRYLDTVCFRWNAPRPTCPVIFVQRKTRMVRICQKCLRQWPREELE